jgi:hypothetical protein
MANLGKCMLFYLKYFSEMERLYEAEEEPSLEGLPDADEVLKKVRLVGETADREAADFLESCVAGIEEHFRGISAVQQVRSNLQKTWELKFRVAPKKAASNRFAVGISYDSDGAWIPWVWCRGGRRAEDETVRILRRGIKGSTLTAWDSGTVCLAQVKVPIPERLDELVPAEPLIAEVQKAFASFTAKEVTAIGAIATNRRDL